ncbi:MAG TPA: hypothetical protein VK211_03880 [Kamptonema sp.]|nr:hypothetical protein [Kamptonema sp.]
MMLPECLYKNNKLKRLPCDYREHPEREELFFCKNCGNSYHIRDIGSDACGWLSLRADSFWLIVGGLILLLVLASNGFFEPRNTNSAPETPTFNQEIQD